MLHIVVLLIWILQCDTSYIISNNTALFNVAMDGLRVVQSGLANVDNVVVSGYWIYWSELGNGRGSISKCHLDGKNSTLLITNLIHVSGFTIAHPNIYYLEMGDPSISPLPRLSVFSLQSTKSRVLLEIRESILPRSITVDVKTGDLFYGTNNGDVMRFEQYRQTLDILVKSTMWPTGLFFEEQCLYIYNGRELQTYNTSTKIITNIPQSWRVDYVTGPTLKYLQVIWTGYKNVSIGVGADKVGFKWDQTEIQSVAVSTPEQELAQCQSTNCEICLPYHNTSHCTCQTGVKKLEGSDKCPQDPDNFILFTQATAISLLSLTTSGSSLVKVKVKYYWDEWVMMDVVYNSDSMFWVEGRLWKQELIQTRIMKRSLFKQSGDEIVHDINGPRIIQSISLDNINSLLYWLDTTTNTITVATIGCSQEHCVKCVIVKEGLERSSGLNVIPNSGYMIYVNNDDSVLRRKLNGQDPIVIFPKDILNITSIAVDHYKEMVYISSSLDSIIVRIPLEGGIQERLYQQRKQFNPISMVVHNTTLYIINDIGRTLLTVSLITKQSKVLLDRLPGLKHVTTSPLINAEGPCSVNNGGCEQFCFALPQSQPLADALSITKECGCADGFRLGPDGVTCEDPPLLYVSVGGIIQSLHPFSPYPIQSDAVAQDRLANITAVELLWSKQYLLWIDQSALTISFSPIRPSQEGYSHTNLVTDGLYDPRDIAVDWISNTLYWVDSAADWISLISLEGAMTVRRIVVRHAGKPSSITLDPTQGLMFWIGWESDGAVIRRANMDGSDVITIVSRNPKWPTDITWDSHKKRVVWVDARYKVVVSCNSDGSDLQYIVGTHYMQYPLALAVWYDHVYWVDKHMQAVYIAKGKDRENVELIRGSLVDITDMVLAHENKQIGTNNCSSNNGGCQYTCVPNSVSSSCLCPWLMELASDLHTCQPLPQQVVGVGLTPHLLSVGRYGEQLNLQQIKQTNSISVHYEHQALYWLGTDTIEMVYLNGTGLRTVFRSTYGATRLALDWLGGNLYWTETETRSIKCVTLSGAYTKVITRSQHAPAFVMVDPPANLLFWFECGEKVLLLSSKLTGKDKRDVLEIPSCPLSADLGRSDSSIFWVDQTFYLHSYNYKRNIKRNITQLSQQNVTTILWVEENLFHFTPDTQTLVSINRIIPVSIHVGNATEFAAYSPLDSGLSNCQIDNGGCTHFCFPGDQKHVCACPAQYELLDDNITCTRPRSACEDGEFRCMTGECIKKILTCDSYHDCLDGSDETVEMCGWCPPDMFSCGKSCISSDMVCNGVMDCPHGEDESYSICSPCTLSGYICKSSGLCLPWSFKCNGVQECQMGDDEQRCSRKVMECGPNEWKCRDDSCIWSTWRCDGAKDCRDGEDESNCPSCNRDEFECSPQKCISNKSVCDQKIDCANSADERDCPERCRKGQRQCESGMCVAEQRWCDRYVDCPDKSDERGCNYTMFDVLLDEDSTSPIGPVIGVVAAALAMAILAVYLIYEMNILPQFKSKYKELQTSNSKTVKTDGCRTNTYSEPDTTLCSSECSSGCDGNHIEMKIRDPYTNDTLTCSSLSDLLRPINGYIDPYQRYGMAPVKSMTDISDGAGPNPSEASGGYSSGPASSRRSQAPPPFINLVNKVWLEEDNVNSVSDYDQSMNFNPDRNYRNYGNSNDGNSECNSDRVYNDDYLNSDVEPMSDIAVSDREFGGFSQPQGSPVTEKSFGRTFHARPGSPITAQYTGHMTSLHARPGSPITTEEEE